jgi:hypothetical protein
MTGTLYHAPSDIIAELISDLRLADLGDTLNCPTGWRVFPTHLPESPDDAILVKDTSGRLHGRTHLDGVMGEHYGIQVLVRSGHRPVTAFRKVKQIMEHFDTVVRRDEVHLIDEDGDTHIYRVNAITRVGPTIPAGNDGRRYFWSGNCIVSIQLIDQIEPTTGTGSTGTGSE